MYGYGYWSDEQYSIIGCTHVYQDIHGSEVYVTEVTREPFQKPYTHLHDRVFVANVSKFIKNIGDCSRHGHIRKHRFRHNSIIEDEISENLKNIEAILKKYAVLKNLLSIAGTIP